MLIVIGWFLIGLVSSIIWFKKEFGKLDITDSLVCIVASVFGPMIFLGWVISWIANKF
jgi:hypothetical protein